MKVFIGVLVGFALLGLMIMASYNELVQMNERVEQSYAQVQNVMQRQADLIPNLVETTKGYAAHESGAFKAIAEARSQLTAAAKIDPRALANDPKLQEQVVAAQANTNRALAQLTATREAYPELKADKLFSNLMVELAGSQNRITVERRTNQLAVQKYNAAIKTFPQVIIANMGGFTTKPYFVASDAAQIAPQVKF